METAWWTCSRTWLRTHTYSLPPTLIHSRTHSHIHTLTHTHRRIDHIDTDTDEPLRAHNLNSHRARWGGRESEGTMAWGWPGLHTHTHTHTTPHTHTHTHTHLTTHPLSLTPHSSVPATNPRKAGRFAARRTDGPMELADWADPPPGAVDKGAPKWRKNADRDRAARLYRDDYARKRAGDCTSHCPGERKQRAHDRSHPCRYSRSVGSSGHGASAWLPWPRLPRSKPSIPIPSLLRLPTWPCPRPLPRPARRPRVLRSKISGRLLFFSSTSPDRVCACVAF